MQKPQDKLPKEIRELATDLHNKLVLNDRNWHKFKSDKSRRAAELLSGALVQLLHGGSHKDVEEFASQAIRWLKGEVKDPGCPKS